ALIGASLGGDSNTVNQSAQMAWRTERFNRQLHPTEKQRIKDLAKELAKEKGKDPKYWEEQLTLVASAMNDEKENQLISAGLAMIFNNEQSAPSISKEKLETERNNLAIAYQVMQNEAKKNQSLKWQNGSDVVLFGEKVKMFQSTESQYKNSQMFGSLNYPSISQYPNNNVATLDDLGRLNGLDNNSLKYRSELFSIIGNSHKDRQDNAGLLNKTYYNYFVTPKGIADPVVLEDLALGGVAYKLGTNAISGTSRLLHATGETFAKTMVSDEAIALGMFAERQLGIVLGGISNTTRTYIGNSLKVAQEAPLKTTVVNGLATGSTATVSEIYDYTKNKNQKEFTRENVYKSIYSISVDISKGLLFGNMPLGAATVGNIVVDKVATGDGNVGKNIATSISGAVWDEKLKASPSPFMREIFIKYSEEKLDNLSSPTERKE
ncbi:hypothetical protein Q7X32_10995, partial [Glaesserella parasuis]|nr:hypothetical protein [Glaesserella parasuis]